MREKPWSDIIQEATPTREEELLLGFLFPKSYGRYGEKTFSPTKRVAQLRQARHLVDQDLPAGVAVVAPHCNIHAATVAWASLWTPTAFVAAEQDDEVFKTCRKNWTRNHNKLMQALHKKRLPAVLVHSELHRLLNNDRPTQKILNQGVALWDLDITLPQKDEVLMAGVIRQYSSPAFAVRRHIHRRNKAGAEDQAERFDRLLSDFADRSPCRLVIAHHPAGEVPHFSEILYQTIWTRK